MEKNNNFQLDDFIKKAVKEAGLESPSSNFTEGILQKIQIASQVRPTVTYRPLIPKSVWWALAIAFIGLLCYAILGNGSPKTEWMPNMGLAWLTNFNISDKIQTISMSDTVIFSMVAIGILISMQLVVLKRYMDSRVVLN